MKCKWVKCLIPIMKSYSTSNGGSQSSSHPDTRRLNRHKCRHLLRTGKTCSIDGPSHQLTCISFMLSAGSNSTKSCNLASLKLTWSTFIWWQVPRIYKKASQCNWNYSNEQHYLCEATCVISSDMNDGLLQGCKTSIFHIYVVRSVTYSQV